MIISAWIVRNPRRIRKCATCDKWMHNSQVRTYGCGDEHDPKYVLYVCILCAEKSPEIVKALDRCNPVVQI